MTDTPYGNADREEERLEDRLRLLGTRTPRCVVHGCSERHPFALTGVYPMLLCVEHLADVQGRNWVELDHPAGQRNEADDRLPIPANDHAVRTHRYQAAWPRDTLRNPDGSPLLRAAASVRGWLDVLRLILERTCGWVPAFLERLDTWLRLRVGSRWWEDFNGWEGFS